MISQIDEKGTKSDPRAVILVLFALLAIIGMVVFFMRHEFGTKISNLESRVRVLERSNIELRSKVMPTKE